MERQNRVVTTFSLFLKLILVLQLPFYQIYSVGATENQMDPNVTDKKSDKDSNCNDRIAKIETKGSKQEKEIMKLKATVVEDRELIHFLSERVARLEKSVKTSGAGSEVAILTRQKRPYRLIPVHEHKGDKEKEDGFQKKGEDNSAGKPFYGPATNCDELGKIGYTLNGYYLVNGKKESTISVIEAIYCYFMQPTAASGLKIEERLGVVTLNFPTTPSQGSDSIFESSIPNTLTRLSTMSSKLISKETSSLIFKPNSTVIRKGGFNSYSTPTTSVTTLSTASNSEPRKMFKLGKMISLEHKMESSYLLRHHHLGKCLAVSTKGQKKNAKNGDKIILSECNPIEKGQLWKITTFNYTARGKTVEVSNICNEWEKCLTVDFEWSKGRTSNLFHWEKIDGEERQIWSPYDRSKTISHFGLSLSVDKNSNPQGAMLNYMKNSYDMWSFYSWIN